MIFICWLKSDREGCISFIILDSPSRAYLKSKVANILKSNNSFHIRQFLSYKHTIDDKTCNNFFCYIPNFTVYIQSNLYYGFRSIMFWKVMIWYDIISVLAKIIHLDNKIGSKIILLYFHLKKKTARLSTNIIYQLFYFLSILW